jgi:adenine-specific DNA-methyltransferase
MAKNNYENYTHAQLVAEIKKLDKRRTYGLVWEEEKTKEKFEKESEGKLPIFTEDKKKEIKTSGLNPTHLLIEGDNYHSLSVLNYTHPKSIDVIYIDPPYNTGKRDFIYNDRIVDKEDDFRHSKWLSFMYKRLRLAYNLLKDDGILLVSIDDNEVAQLKLLLDRIFNRSNNPDLSNLLGMVVWNLGTGTQAGHFTRSHEYILCYTKNKIALPNFKGGEGIIEHSALKKISKKNPESNFHFKKGTRFDAENGVELKESWGGSERTSLVSGKMVAFKGKLKYDVTLSAGWAMKEQMKEWFNGAETYDTKGQKVLGFYFNSSGVLKYRKERTITNPKTVISDVGSTKTGSDLLRSMFNGKEVFDFPKPVSLIKHILNFKDNNITVLDFFAGTGTTAHAVLELNNEDNGRRKVILATNNENDICTNVCYPRIKKVIIGYKAHKNGKVAGIKSNLKYYTTRFVDAEPTHRNKKILTEKSVEILCIKEDTFELVKKTKDIAIFKNDEKYMAILFDEIKLDEFINEIKKLKKPISVYVFSLEGDDFKDEFEVLKQDISLCSVPEAILKVYRRIYETTKPKK